MHNHFLEFHSLHPDTISGILERASEMEKLWDERAMPQTLSGKRVGLIVDDSGWRNTTAIELGVKSMGGICVVSPVKFSTGEAIADLGGYLSNWFDLLVIRTKELKKLKELAAVIDVPIINARTQSNHPCETLGDLAYVRSVRGTLEGLKVVCIAADANILRSWVEAAKSLPIQVTQVFPQQWHLSDPLLLSTNFSTSTDLQDACDADLIITDSWPNTSNSHDLLRYQVTASVLNNSRQDVIFLPCPPVTRGHEVAADAMLHKSCRSRQAKAFLLHAQNALMEWATSRL